MTVKPPKTKEKKLTPKQQLFIREYQVDLNASQAAIRAGYSPKTAKKIGQENMGKPALRDALCGLVKEKCEKTEITADFVLGGLRRLAAQCENTEGKGHNPSAAAKSYELLGKYLKLFTEKVEHSGELGLKITVVDRFGGEKP